MNTDFKKYRRSQVAELRPVEQSDIDHFIHRNDERIPAFAEWNISVSSEDLKNGSPKMGDMVARNPKNHMDQWLVAEQYFNDNFEDADLTPNPEQLLPIIKKVFGKELVLLCKKYQQWSEIEAKQKPSFEYWLSCEHRKEERQERANLELSPFYMAIKGRLERKEESK